MARKAFNGYPEKSYYDNTMYGGIVATGDPLNEGSFALLTNFDITDSGKSIVPRKGYLTTTFTNEGVSVVLDDKVLLYRDPNISKHIILNLNKPLNELAYAVDITQYNIVDNKLANARHIVNYDYVDILTYMKNQSETFNDYVDDELLLRHIFTASRIVGTPTLHPIRDTNGTTYYVTKMEYVSIGIVIPYWIRVAYRENEAPRLEENNLEDTLIISVVDMTGQTANFTNRNIASNKSIIPNPIREIGDELTDVNRPILLKINDRYVSQALPNTLKNTLDIKVEPTFFLQDAENFVVEKEKGKWAYRFDIISTNSKDTTPTYKTPWRELKPENILEGDNKIINEIYLSHPDVVKPVYTYYVVPRNITTPIGESQGLQIPTAKKVSESLVSDYMSGTQNLRDVYNLQKAAIDLITEQKDKIITELSLSMIDDSDLCFITEDEMRKNILVTSPETLTTLTNRKAYARETQVYPDWWVKPMWQDIVASAPMMQVHHNSYLTMNKQTSAEFKEHAIVKSMDYTIRIIYMPFAKQMQSTGAGNLPELNNRVFFVTAQSIYIEGIDDVVIQPEEAASLANIMQLPEETLLDMGQYAAAVDVFGNLGKLNIKDTIELIPRSTYDKAVSLVLYLRPYSTDELLYLEDKTQMELKVINSLWDTTAYIQSTITVWTDPKSVVYIDEVQNEDYNIIRNANNSIVFEDRLVVWSANKVYISEEGEYGYFTSKMKKEFPEEVLKVIAFKTILLVFTTQHLYAIHRVEAETPSGTFDKDGVPEVMLEVIWLQQPVLYNINPERRYLDVIQVYNQMILFYSNEGQLYMIRPSTTIDNETQFGIQYFNKAANNIFANYEDYINERLRTYNKLNVDDPNDYVTKDDVNIKAIVDIDTIRILYSVKDRITFIINYDVVNNRYTTYDTLNFTEVVSVQHIEGGELYITQAKNRTYFTLPIIGTNDVDINIDMHYNKMFKKEPVFTYLDTGSLNLNNHLRKRLRDLKIVLKNLDATKILYNAEVLLDDTVIHAMYAPTFNVKMINGPDSNLVVDPTPIDDLNELFGMDQTIGRDGSRTDFSSYYLHEDKTFFNRHSLLKTETLNSNRLIEYNSSVLGMGKVIRIRLQFISKGRYKLQSFGIVYKERSI